VSFENKSLETADLKKLSKVAYDRAKHLLNAWRIDDKTGRDVSRSKKRPANEAPSPAVTKVRE